MKYYYKERPCMVLGVRTTAYRVRAQALFAIVAIEPMSTKRTLGYSARTFSGIENRSLKYIYSYKFHRFELSKKDLLVPSRSMLLEPVYFFLGRYAQWDSLTIITHPCRFFLVALYLSKSPDTRMHVRIVSNLEQKVSAANSHRQEDSLCSEIL